MAYTSVIPVRRLDRTVKYVMNKEKTTAVSLQDALDYAANRDKTEQSCFESSYACTLETAFADMRQTKECWHKLGSVQGYHLVQSFAAGEVTPELAHRIAKELADRVLGGRYEYVIGTHLNTGHIQHLAKQKHNLTRIHTLGYIEEPQFIERSAAIEQQIRERKQQLSRNDMSNTSEKILQKTRLIQKKLSSTPPLELFDESVFKELVKKVLISNTAIQFELINGMKLSESRAAT